MEGEMCTSMCQIRPQKEIYKKTRYYFCDTKALTEVSNRIRPTSELLLVLLLLLSLLLVVVVVVLFIIKSSPEIGPWIREQQGNKKATPNI